MGTKFRGTGEEERALNTLIKLLRASDSVTARLVGHLPEAGLTESQFAVLEALLHLGPLPQCDIAQKLLKSGGNITHVVDNLERNELVRRERNTHDRRFVTVHLTPEGKELIEGIFPRHVAGVVAVMSALSAGEQEELGRLCRKLGKSAALHQESVSEKEGS